MALRCDCTAEHADGRCGEDADPTTGRCPACRPCSACGHVHGRHREGVCQQWQDHPPGGDQALNDAVTVHSPDLLPRQEPHPALLPAPGRRSSLAVLTPPRPAPERGQRLAEQLDLLSAAQAHADELGQQVRERDGAGARHREALCAAAKALCGAARGDDYPAAEAYHAQCLAAMIAWTASRAEATHTAERAVTALANVRRVKESILGGY